MCIRDSPVAYSLYNFYEATMTIKGSLQMKILYRGVFVQVQFWAQISTLGGFLGVKY